MSDRLRLLVLVALVVLALAGCQDDPEETAARDAAERLVTAVLHQDGPAMDSLFCSNVPEDSGGDALLGLWSIGLAAWQADIPIASLNPEFSYEVVAIDDAMADVVIVGDIDVNDELRANEVISGMPDGDTFHIDVTWHLIVEEGSWRMCGAN